MKTRDHLAPKIPSEGEGSALLARRVVIARRPSSGDRGLRLRHVAVLLGLMAEEAGDVELAILIR
jgi:hypothetical protein